jgi:ABC-type Fe3+-hydroxamate transport system substrate-binding protein
LRIISTVPSQTELLAALGLDLEVVGITKFCVHPDHWFRSKARVGGTKALDLDKIHALRPDLILANKEENTQSEIELLAKTYPTYVSDVKTLDDALEMIATIGELTSRAPQALKLVDEIMEKFKRIAVHSQPKSALYFIWNDPWLVAGADTFISSMLPYAGFENAMTSVRYPEVMDLHIHQLNPEFILLSSEPYPFKKQHVSAMQRKFPQSKVMLVDGEMFSWYGSRLALSALYFNEIGASL